VSWQDEDRCEEWERHEALHDDVTSQDRCKERLFEEEIELKWEKGGSGLVFYTDAQYWQEEEGGTHTHGTLSTRLSKVYTYLAIDWFYICLCSLFWLLKDGHLCMSITQGLFVRCS